MDMAREMFEETSDLLTEDETRALYVELDAANARIRLLEAVVEATRIRRASIWGPDFDGLDSKIDAALDALDRKAP